MTVRRCTILRRSPTHARSGTCAIRARLHARGVAMTGQGERSAWRSNEGRSVSIAPTSTDPRVEPGDGGARAGRRLELQSRRRNRFPSKRPVRAHGVPTGARPQPAIGLTATWAAPRRWRVARSGKVGGMATARRADMFMDLDDDPRETAAALATSAPRSSSPCAVSASRWR